MYYEHNEEEAFQITPKGITAFCLAISGILNDDNEDRFDDFWLLFSSKMKDFGYMDTFDE